MEQRRRDRLEWRLVAAAPPAVGALLWTSAAFELPIRLTRAVATTQVLSDPGALWGVLAELSIAAGLAAVALAVATRWRPLAAVAALCAVPALIGVFAEQRAISASSGYALLDAAMLAAWEPVRWASAAFTLGTAACLLVSGVVLLVPALPRGLGAVWLLVPLLGIARVVSWMRFGLAAWGVIVWDVALVASWVEVAAMGLIAALMPLAVWFGRSRQ